MEEKKISIIIPSYNNPQELRMTINSIICSNLDKENFEILVCDDGSQNGLINIVKEFENKLDIRYFYQPDCGFRVAAARNMGINAAKYDICMFLDSGILVNTDTIDKLTTPLLTDHVACLGYVLGFSNSSENNDLIMKSIDKNDIPKSVNNLLKKGVLDRRQVGLELMDVSFTEWPAPWCYFTAGLAAVRRDDLLNFGKFDESFNEWGVEDTDVGITLFKNGVKLIFDTTAFGIHLPHKKNNLCEKDFPAFIKTLKKQRLYLYEKHKLPEILVWAEEEMNSDLLNPYLLSKKNE